MVFSTNKMNDIEQIVYYSDDIKKISESLNEIILEKSNIEYPSEYYCHLCNLESYAHYKISKSEISDIETVS